MSVDPGALLARKTWRTLEPLHGMIYFVPEAAEAYERLGIKGRAGYFASRAAPMGAVAAELVVATFFNFNPDLVHAAIPGAWDITTPEALVNARLAAVDGAFRRVLGNEVLESRSMARAAELARGLAETAGAHVEGRPSTRGTPTSSGRTHRISCSGTPSRSCANTGATGMWRSCSRTGSRALTRWSPTPPPVTCLPMPCAPPGAGALSSGTLPWARCGDGVGWPRATTWCSPTGARRNARRSKIRPMPWRRGRTPLWDKTVAQSCAP